MLVDQWTQPGHPGGDECDGVCVGGVGHAALTGGDHPRPRGQLRRDVNDLLALGEQPSGDVPADALAAFDSPDPVRPLLGILTVAVQPARSVLKRPVPRTASSLIITSMVAERLC
ncbi:hypothetical protein [Micromonospora sp. KC207]|uniref:hypothetical protein n=1 Tax=Micromonospora sp. KC207 TaxID=2530377 RepID=UPI001404BCC2|nr:hypothetical protein [Micromonospora sp. KC207]